MHWRNSDFQIAHFLAGKCHTADGAYRMLMELREERVIALNGARAGELRTLARIQKAKAWWRNLLPWMRLENQADLIEIEGTRAQVQACIVAAEHEVATIDAMIKAITPHRQFAHLPDAQAHQVCQREEWALELMNRAENMLATQGVSWDQLATMRQHPDWETRLLPHIEEIARRKQQDGVLMLKGQCSFVRLEDRTESLH